jgi:hypothetical protein
MKDFDLSKITGNEPPLITDDEKDAELYRLRRELAEMTAKARIDEQQCDDMTKLAADAVARAERAEARVRELEEALPKTKDGVTVLPGMYIFDVDPNGYVEEVRVCRTWEKRGTSSQPLPHYGWEGSMYAKREEAEAKAELVRKETPDA